MSEGPRLILLNGPQGVGKSTLAARFVDEHPLALDLDMDVLRVSIGGWSEQDESKLLARRLGLAMARTHLAAGHDVVVPQLLVRTGFIDELRDVAADVGGELVELLVMTTKETSIERFRARRANLDDHERHPEEEIEDADVERVISETHDALLEIAERRPQTRVVEAHGDADATYASVMQAIDADGGA